MKSVCEKAVTTTMAQHSWQVRKLGLKMCTRTGMKHAYQGVQGACPQQAVTSTGGMAKLVRVGAGLKLVYVNCINVFVSNHST